MIPMWPKASLAPSLGLFPPPFTSDAVVGMSALSLPSPRASEAEEKVLRRQAKFKVAGCNRHVRAGILTTHAKGDGDIITSAGRAYLSSKRFNLNGVLFTYKITVRMHNICRLAEFLSRLYEAKRSFMPSNAVKPGSGFCKKLCELLAL